MPRGRINYSTQAETKQLQDEFKVLKEEESGRHRSQKVAKTDIPNATPVKPTPAQNSNQLPAPKAPPPPPPPPGFRPPPPATSNVQSSQKPSGAGKNDARGALLEEIEKGIKLRSVQNNLNHPSQKPVKRDEQTASITYKTGKEYLEKGLVDYYEEQLKQLIIGCEGIAKEDTPPGLVRLMKGHAKETGKDKFLIPTKASDNFNEDVVKERVKAKEKAEYKGLDREARLQADAAEHSRSTTVSAYQQYVRGRDKKLDSRNDFYETFHKYSSEKLTKYETTGKLKEKMLNDYGIYPSVRAPNLFFDDHPELKSILDELEVPVYWLDDSDMTAELLDALVHFRKTGNKDRLKKPINTVIDRMLEKNKKQQEELKKSEENLKKFSDGLS